MKRQTAQFVQGNLKSPGYRTQRALTEALFPLGDPERREATPKSVEAITLEDVKQYHAKAIRPDLTTIVVIGNVSAGEARSVIEKWFGAWKALWTETGCYAPARARQQSLRREHPGPEPIAG